MFAQLIALEGFHEALQAQDAQAAPAVDGAHPMAATAVDLISTHKRPRRQLSQARPVGGPVRPFSADDAPLSAGVPAWASHNRVRVIVTDPENWAAVVGKDDVCLVLLNKKADERSGSAAADRSSTAALGDEVRKRSLSAFYL